jgi:Neurotransmitter-gated ion-channel ligand binding domain
MNVKRKLKPFVIVIRSVLILGLATLTSVCHAQVGASRPTKDGSPTPVRVGIFVLNVDKIDSAEQTFSASVYLETRWHDPSLAHSRKTVKRPLDQIWHPHLQFVNQRAAWRTFPEIADVLGNGEVIYRQRVWGSFAQPLDLRAFPFDRQLLTIPIVAAGYDREEVEIVRLIPDKVGESAIAAKFSLPDWDVEKAEVSAGRYAVLPGSEGVPALVLKMEVKRNVLDLFLDQSG